MLRDLGRNLISGARLCFLLSVDKRDFRPSSEQAFLLLFAIAFAVLTIDIATMEGSGPPPLERVGLYALAVIAGLLGCFVATRLLGMADRMTGVIVLVLASSFWLTPVFGPMIVLAGPDALEPGEPAGIFVAMAVFLWFLVIATRAIQRQIGGGHAKAAIAACLIVIFTALPRLLVADPNAWLPAAAKLPATALQENLYYGQFGMMNRAIEWLQPHRPGTTDLYFVAFGADAREDVVLNEMRSTAQLLDERFDTKERSIVLLNHRRTVRQVPLANLHNLGRALEEIGKRIDPEEDIVFLYLSTPGMKELEINPTFEPLEFLPIHASQIRRMMDDAGIKWRVVVLSACRTDGFAERLRNDYTAVITAARDGNRAYGCRGAGKFTYFGKAFFDLALKRGFSIPAAFDEAAKFLAEREDAENRRPSLPQMRLGASIAEKLAELESRLAAAFAAKTTTDKAVRPN